MIRASVLASHRAVLGLTLRCRNEGALVGDTILYPDWDDEVNRQAEKTDPCVRDVVAPCRSCNVVICRASIYSCFFLPHFPIDMWGDASTCVVVSQSALVLTTSCCSMYIELRHAAGLLQRVRPAPSPSLHDLLRGAHRKDRLSKHRRDPAPKRRASAALGLRLRDRGPRLAVPALQRHRPRQG